MRIREIILNIPINLLRFKIFNLIKYFIFRKFKQSYLKFKPIIMDIEPTTGCNFRCTMCQVSDPSFVAKNLDIETFKKVILNNKQLINIKLQGMGEPLVNTRIYDMIDFANKYGISVEFVTNGSLLNENNLNKLLNCTLSRISVSVDGSTKEVFEKIRVKSNFDLVVNNISRFTKIFKSRGKKTEIRALALIQKANFHQLESITSLCKDLGFDSLNYQVQLTGWGKSEWEKTNLDQDINYNSDLKLKFEEIIKKYESKDFRIEIVEENLLNFNKQCSYPYETPYISATGHVVPCCMIADHKVVNMGSLKDNSFQEIWNSKKYLEFRKNIKTNNLESFCKNCYKEYRK